jgi:hypothetical protein
MSECDEKKKYPRHLVAKAQKKHTLYYWQPSAGLRRLGWSTVPLGKDEATAIKGAEALNAKVDQWRGGQPVLAQNRHGTLPWLIEHYKNDHAYKKLRRKKAHDGYIRKLLAWSAERGDPPMRTIKRSDAKALWTEWVEKGKLPTATHTISAGSTLWNFALEELEDHGVVDNNPFARLRLPKPPPRQVQWEPEQITAVINQALITPVHTRGRRPQILGYRKSIADAVMLIHNTTLRECDVLALMESDYDGHKITCVPSKTRDKTGFKFNCPATPELKAWLDGMLAARRASRVVSLHQQDRPLVINESNGRRYAGNTFGHVFT